MKQGPALVMYGCTGYERSQAVHNGMCTPTDTFGSPECALDLVVVYIHCL